jgi:biotin carboxyl carrier protein
MRYIAHAGDSEFVVEIDREGVVKLNGEVIDADLKPSMDSTLYSLILGHHSHELRIEPQEGSYRVQLEGIGYDVVVEDERTRRLAGVKRAGAGSDGEAVVKSPMPGVVIDVRVGVGDPVETGQTLVVVESMKMHNEFQAPRNGTVSAVRVEPGAKVAQNTIMVTIK